MIPETKISERSVGSAYPVYIIAEAGVNHNGDRDQARQLIDAAQAAGADAVKFQLFSAEKLVSKVAPSCGYQVAHGAVATQRDLLRRLELKHETFVELAAHARRRGIEILATPFGLDELEFLQRQSPAVIKIASPDLVNVPLLSAAAETDSTLIVSTGAAELDEIDEAVALVRRLQRGRKLALLHCVSAYPTPPREARLRCIQVLTERYALPVGFSDHTDDAAFGALAVAAGAVILEKHLTLDRRASGPDHFFSLESSAFAEYVQRAREAQAALGDGVVRPSASEREVRELARGGLIAVKAIPRGSLLTADCLAVQRPASGIAPRHWNEIIGRRAKTDIPAAARLNWSMIE